MQDELTQWEYKTVRSKNLGMDLEEVDKNLNKLGSEGWEITGTLSNENGDGKILLKRPKQKKSEY